jgi:dipeptidyl aminopeptidase/acylaminoacyl peptidase
VGMVMGMKLRAAAAGVCILFWAGQGWSQTRPPVEAFGQLPTSSEPSISPDGKHVALKQAVKGAPAAVIYEIGAPAGTKPYLVPSTDWVIDDIRWVKNDRLALTVKKSFKAPDDDKMRTWEREVTVSEKGDGGVVLNNNQISLGNNVGGSEIIDVDLDDPDRAFVPLYVFNLAGDANPNMHDDDDDFRLNILAVNVRTGESHTFLSGSTHTTAWYMDGHGHVVARIDETKRPLKEHLKFYDGSDWHDAGTFDATGDRGSGLVGLTEDGNAAAFAARDSQSMKVLEAHPFAHPESSNLLFQTDGYDLDDVLTDEWSGRVIGAAYADDRMEYVYFDPKLEALQRGLERAFPNLSVHAVSSDITRNNVIVAVDGPRQPLAYYFLDRTTHQAELIKSSYPALSDADLGDMKPYPYKARDGLDIHAYLTLPPGSVGRNLPLVVMPHGGPDSRDMLGFDWMGQFFANRGYAVFQPNYRGSSGYGHKFTEAGLQQWGLKMQDDITDGVRKLIADGVVDPKRVCIVGGSYGGYAALAGAAFTPDLYACAVSFAGVSDLPQMLQTERNDYGKDSDVVSFWASRIGSPYDDSDQLRATSPARHADQVKCPVLLMHGEGDTTVRIKQSELMYDALTDAHKDVQFIRFPGEDHYFTFADTRIRFLTEVEKFLAAHIGTASTAQK